MTLVIEDGIGVYGANSYASLDCADSWCVPRGLWPATGIEPDAGTETPDAAIIAAKEAALMRAFDWLNGLDWLGQKPDWEREAAWPRKNAPMPGSDREFLPEDCVPPQVVRAQLELAALIYSSAADPFAPLERGGKVVSESHSFTDGDIDVIGGDSRKDSYTYADAAPVETYYPAVARLLRDFLASVPGEVKNGFCVMPVLPG